MTCIPKNTLRCAAFPHLVTASVQRRSTWKHRAWNPIARATTLALALAATTPLMAWAGPGAHGPNGEHLDQPSASATGAAAAQPRLEAKSERFELIGTLHATELSILIDRYDSNEPVLNAKLEVESGALKAQATFHADHGDYAVDDPAMLKALATPGEHALVFTVVAGQDSDLLDGVLVTASAGAQPGKHDHDDHGHGHDHERALWISAGLFVAAVIIGILWKRRRNSISALRRQGGKA